MTGVSVGSKIAKQATPVCPELLAELALCAKRGPTHGPLAHSQEISFNGDLLGTMPHSLSSETLATQMVGTGGLVGREGCPR